MLCASSSSRWSIEGGGSGRPAKIFGTDDASVEGCGLQPVSAGFIVEKMHLWALDLRVRKIL